MAPFRDAGVRSHSAAGSETLDCHGHIHLHRITLSLFFAHLLRNVEKRREEQKFCGLLFLVKLESFE